MTLSPTPTILLPNLPPKTLVGIDLITFTSTPNFHGIRDLPAGWHFLYTGTTESLSLRSGGWFHIRADDSPSRAPDVLIWKWNADTETLVPLRAADTHEAMRCRANLGAIWQAGGLFRYRSRVPPGGHTAMVRTGHTADDDDNEVEGRNDWQALTDRLSPALLTRVVGTPDVDVDGRPRWMVTSGSSAARDNDAIPGLPDVRASAEMARVTGAPESEFSFLAVDLKRTWREGAIGRERSEAAQDRSWALGEVVRRAEEAAATTPGGDGGGGEAQVLGELQFTFLMVLTLMNYSCLQQWKRLLELVLTCQSAIRDRAAFMSAVLRLLLLQLQRCDDVEGGLFDLDGEDGGAFLRKLLVRFRRSLYGVDSAGEAVKSEFAKLEAWVREEYDWELDREAVVRRGMVQLEDGEQVELQMDEDEDEYAPVVVDLGEDNMEVSLGDQDEAEIDDPRM
ncbi:AAR2 domain protein [Aspergillus terreus]|uniref:AAR2 domain protein n=1 Tax=Aspergillus terreus TaxID=33178 RepID=A0A5M3YP92_ASPTE|nr:hypothetical protein ATETN484_0002047500 [Aspergillus terreus]GFF15331.1 AAR2 domain protein [Aspergillus terreus]